MDELNKIEQATRGQSNSYEWKKQRKLRITASNFARTTNRKRQRESLAKEFLEGKSFTSKYTTRGLEYESTALDQHKKYMSTTAKRVKVCKSGLVVCLDSTLVLHQTAKSEMVDVVIVLDLLRLSVLKLITTLLNLMHAHMKTSVWKIWMASQS